MTVVITRNFDAQATAELLDYPSLVRVLRQTVLEYGAGKIVSPERQVVPLQEGGLMLSMPASAEDIAIHKLVNVCPSNGKRQLPTIHGQVVACDAHSGEMLFVLDGPTVTGRRTAAVTVLGIQTLHGMQPQEIVIIGTGKQATNHAEALSATFPRARLYVKGKLASVRSGIRRANTAVSTESLRPRWRRDSGQRRGRHHAHDKSIPCLRRACSPGASGGRRRRFYARCGGSR